MKKLILISIMLLLCIQAILCEVHKSDTNAGEQLKKEAMERALAHLSELKATISDTTTTELGREMAAYELGWSRDKSVIPYLENAIQNDPSERVRAVCADALGWLESFDSKEILITSMKYDTSEQVKIKAALTLSILGDTLYCFSKFKEMWEKDDFHIRLKATRGFHNIGSTEAIQYLIEGLSDENPHVISSSAKYLIEFGNIDLAFPKVKELLNHPDWGTRKGAVLRLGEINNSESISLIKSMLKDKDFRVRNQAKRILLNKDIEFEEEKDDEKDSSSRNYSPENAAAYADEWWDDRNTDEYNNYSGQGGDCSNFVSQCLIAGGLDLSAGIDETLPQGTGPGQNGVDDCGFIPYCDNLHIHLTNYQSLLYFERLTSDDPLGPLDYYKGDPAIYNRDDNEWAHAVIARSGDEYDWAEVASHDPDINYVLVNYFYNDPNYNLTSCWFYMMSSSTRTEDLIASSIFSSLSNHPNPFNPTTTISYSLGEYIQNPQIEIYNIKGQKVKIYQLENKAGESSIVWNGIDGNERTVSSGVYFYRLVNEGKTVQTRKMILMK